MAGDVGPTEPSPRGGAARWSWLLPAGTFVAGCALGGTLVGVGAVGGDDEDVPTTSAAATETPSPTAEQPDPADTGAGLYVRVPESCVQTADDATTLVEHVDRVVAAVAELEPERLRRTVDEVQQVRDQVQSVAEQCRQDAARRLQQAAGAEATPAS